MKIFNFREERQESVSRCKENSLPMEKIKRLKCSSGMKEKVKEDK